MSKISKLRDLTTKPATPEHQEEFNKQTSEDADDRSYCLLLASMLENTLDKALDHWIGEQSGELRKGLYGPDGMIATFSRKITLAQVIKLIGPTTCENFRLMRNVRNACAHAKIPITFKTDEVAAVCADLVRINIFDPEEEPDQDPKLSPRKRFEIVCNETMIRLLSYTGHDVQYRDDEGRSRKIIDGVLP